jgi:shikimate dehydrogenase
MSTSPSLQEIICCIGHPVAGNPTQYVMERAFAAAGFDCRCLTVDVPPAAVSNALAGIAALGFRGAVIAPPHQTTVPKYLDRLAGVAAQGGFVDLLHRDQNTLVGSQTFAPAVICLIRQTTDPAGKQALVLADEPKGTSIALELAAAGAHGLKPVLRL